MNLTERELHALENQLAFEQVLVKKYRFFAEICYEENIKA